VPHLGVHAHATNALSVLPRAAVDTSHYLRVPVHAVGQIQAVTACLSAQKVPVRQVALAAECSGTGPQVLVLTGPVVQGTLDLAVHALQARNEVAGPVVTLRVEALEG
jgi:homoserine dehydrogenase